MSAGSSVNRHSVRDAAYPLQRAFSICDSRTKHGGPSTDDGFATRESQRRLGDTSDEADSL